MISDYLIISLRTHEYNLCDLYQFPSDDIHHWYVGMGEENRFSNQCLPVLC